MTGSAWAGTNFGILSSGDNATNVAVRFDGAPPRPEEVAYVPPSPVHLHGLFVGRERELAAVHTALTSGNGVITQAITGLGGIGKTTLAKHYAVAYREQYTMVHWLVAESAEQIESELARLAARIDARFALAPVAFAAAWARAWLVAHPGWLLVLDNVVDREDVVPLMQDLAGGRFLVTTRVATGWRGISPLRLGTLPPDAAIALLGELAGSPIDAEAARGICEELGWLPLAIEQAGSFLEQTRIGAADYLELVRNSHGVDAIARVWNVTMDRIAAQDLLAVELLGVLAWFAPVAVPRRLLDPMGTTATVAAALGLLHRYSMIELSEAEITVHRLVQSGARNGMGSSGPAYCQRATALIDRSISAGSVPVPQLLGHLDALCGHITDGFDEVYQHLISICVGLDALGMSHRVVAHLQRITSHLDSTLGPEAAETLRCRGLLASAYLARGEVRSGHTELADVLAITERSHGPRTIETIRAQANLGQAFYEARDYKRSIEIYQAVLTALEEVADPDGEVTLATRYNLASAYRVTGRIPAAISLLEATLPDCERLLGRDDISTFNVRTVLAHCYGAQGDMERSMANFGEILTDSERALGPHHRNTLIVRSQLAHAHKAAGHLDLAVTMGKAVARDTAAILGPDDPDALTARFDLAVALADAGETEQATIMLTALVKRTRRVYGPTHERTVSAENELAELACRSSTVRSSP
ncbi:tetratricopeptide (TPR) repeat protein [Catenulispora sp. GP43]|uniref:FxSxx-COOH system tetratricopeptide repeat protein n=1 Tax=Catenulispora sp. GP43 TaxID=3156263 RepID=UPI0035183333